MRLYVRYSKGALVSDGDSLSSAQEAPTGCRRDYIPSSDPGSRLPHMNIQVLSVNLSQVCQLVPHRSLSLYVCLWIFYVKLNLSLSALAEGTF